MDLQTKMAEKQKRVNDAIAVKEPDRVPIGPKMGLYFGSAYNISHYDVMMDLRNILPGVEAFLNQFDPDVVWTPFTYSIPAMEALGTNYISWPGQTHNLPLDSSFQIHDGSYVEDDEFMEFAHDPTHFFLTKIFPRKHDKLKGLSKLYLRNPIEINQFIDFTAFTDPEVKEAIEAMTRCGEAMLKWLEGSGLIAKFITDRGFLLGPGLAQSCPYDMFSDNYRGLIQTTMDVLERPEELEAVLDIMTEICVERTISAAKFANVKSVLIPLHGGVDEFMSHENYLRFYWKGLKAMMDALVENDIIPYVFCEGNYNSRLETLAEFTPGKAVFMFEKADMKKVKQTVGKHSCICANVPASLMVYGTPDQVTEEVKKVIDICAPGGGFMMDVSIELVNAQPRNVEAYFEASHKYGKY